jgi:tetratricopeptide (TPR) repeat protein
LVLLCLLLAAGVWRDELEQMAAGRPSRPPRQPPPELVLAARQAAEAEVTEAAPALRGGPAQAAAEQPFYGFCPESDEAMAPPDRPDLGEQVSLRVSELLDVARAAQRDPDSSRELVAGLRGLFTEASIDRVLETLERAPDRRHGELDLAASAALILGARAYGRKQPAEALRLARWATARAPKDAVAQGLLALAADAVAEPAAARNALRAAHASEPDEPLYALSLGQALANTGALDEAVGALDAYLQSAPKDVPIAQLRARLDTRRELERDFAQLQLRAVTLRYPADKLDARAANALLQEIDATLQEAARLLGRPVSSELTVVVHGARSELLASTCVPTWTEGVFDGVLRLHMDALSPPERRVRVVRHETLHAQLHAARVPAPQWFHEGLAQYFAHEFGPSTHKSFAMMVANRTYVPFASLEGSFLVIGPSQDARLAYHQSLAMVQLLIAEGGEAVIARAIDYLGSGGDPGQLMGPPLAPRLLEGRDLLKFLAAGTGG